MADLYEDLGEPRTQPTQRLEQKYSCSAARSGLQFIHYVDDFQPLAG
ncbi:hypothetical protein [Thauera chlorobenzoica]|uniref:Uncharacterized protein n=1 Tax=Thauera chlorobenzoica TaxID=96773 RepID=A0A1L6F7L2_9RHOO|nr:hypothetical protein [Thauera chlorobenzoica]APR02899.1 hypothetical protein Tchl_0023 [Thauera chlorobenzoica]